MIFETWESRCEFLEQLQNDITSTFTRDDYNIFLFGSFMRDDYDPYNSDIDLAIYTKDYLLYLDVLNYLEDYLNSRDIRYSIIRIDESNTKAFVAIDPLCHNVGVTSFFPEILKTYMLELIHNFICYNEEKSWMPSIYSPDGELIFKPVEF